MNYSMFKLAVVGSTTGTVGSGAANTNKPGDFRYLLNTTLDEAQRRKSTIPGFNFFNAGIVGPSTIKAEQAVNDTTNSYFDYLNWRQQTGRGMPVGVNFVGGTYDPDGMLDVPTGASPQPAATTANQQNTTNQYTNKPQSTQPNTQPTQQTTKQAPATNTNGNPGSVIPADLLNNDAINRIKDPKEMRKYLEVMLPVSAGLQQLASGGKFNMDAVLENDTAVEGFSKALETANPMALQVLQQMQKEMAGDNKGKGDAKSTTNAEGSTTPSVKDQNMKKLTNAAAKGVWNSVKENPIENFPKAIGMFLSHIGAGQGITDFVSNPFAFYGSLLTLLVGGGLLMGGTGDGSSQQQPQVVNNYYGQQPQRGFNTFA